MCDNCHKEVDAVYDLIPTEASSDYTLRVCNECYRDVARELEDNGIM